MDFFPPVTLNVFSIMKKKASNLSLGFLHDGGNNSLLENVKSSLIELNRAALTSYGQ